MPKIQIGEYTIDTWYAAPYPQEYNVLPCLFLCEFCFKYMKSEFGLKRHMLKCTTRHPPGDEIYREGNISVFEVDGRKHKIYCQNLCLLSKIFLDHKTLYYDVEPFLFYIMTEQTETGAHFVGYFSKEKRSLANYNVSCILTLPIHQRKGYGNFLIQFSYLLTSKEDKYGSPEKPLSDLGLLSYRHYWRTAVVNAILDLDDDLLTIDDIMTKTRMTADDVVHTLFLMNMLHKNAKGDYVLVKNKQALLEYKDKILAKGYIQVKPELLQWDPVLFNRIE
ncbi:acyl-CoA N-acyltransferase [Gorgonomyces haynaldii]|nr:acyl-CoA N-acyltransferase [Gorgonomyces haynaldii]